MNNLRSSQLLSPFGVGQIVNFPGEQSYMICGLDLWDNMLRIRKDSGGKINKEEFTIRESRLERLLNVTGFVKPFPFKKQGDANTYLKVPAIRFPQWYHCTNTKCGAMRMIPLTQVEIPICEACTDKGHLKGKKYKHKMIPVRFIAACHHGHIQDIPFKELVHNGQVPSDGNQHLLSYHAGSGSGDLSSIRIKCSCGASKSLGGIMNVSKDDDAIIYNSALASIGLTEAERLNINSQNPNHDNPIGQYCNGSRPWLGPNHMDANCHAHLQVLIRGGSNIHYADIISALYLPEFDKNTNEYVGKIVDALGIDKLTDYYNQTPDHSILRIILGARAEIINGLVQFDIAFNEIEELIKKENQTDNNEVQTEIDLRFQEYQYILNERNSENSDFKSIVNSFEEYRERDFLQRHFEKVVLIQKLKETRVFRSFARINPYPRVNTSELSAQPITWLPATQVSGEGIFLEFKKTKIDEWLKQYTDYKLLERYRDNIRTPNPRHEGGLNPAFVMIHTFAHLLIKRLCFNCGYGSSALRERIYFSLDPQRKMNGILIYTSSGDSEGSLGGLVRLAKENYLGSLIKEALADAEWCSADPVCSDIGQTSGQGPDNINGSACHNCCLLPETSCEEFNILLDRALIIGSHNNPCMGYFSI